MYNVMNFLREDSYSSYPIVVSIRVNRPIPPAMLAKKERPNIRGG
jgi:hypothetical protein